MNEPNWVLPEVVLAVHQMLLAEHGGSNGIRDQGLLDSALNRPKQRYTYQQPVSLFELAAAYSFGIARNHPFVDGNKRVALTVGAIFLEINGYSLNAPESEAVIVFEQLAADLIKEPDLTHWLQVSSVVIPVIVVT